MLTGRGWAVLGGSLVLWAGARIAGSPELHIVATGLAVLVVLSLALVRGVRPNVRVTRRLSSRRAFPGTRIRAELTVSSRGSRTTPVLLLEDAVPATLGPPARMVVGALRPRADRAVTYDLTCRARGRYEIGPLRLVVADPFDLARRSIEIPDRQDLVVYPTVELLVRGPAGGNGGASGESAARRLLRAGDEFYIMRPYEVGDDLRRIHWPSTARTGELMIRHDEAMRRSDVLVFLDTRATAFRSPAGFETAVSAAASIGAHHLRVGHGLRLATPDGVPVTLGREEFLETLAVVTPSWERQIVASLQRLRAPEAAGAALVVVTRVPDSSELTALCRLGPAFGPKMAVLVDRPARDGEPRRSEGSPSAARMSLLRSGWEVVVVRAGATLRDAWRRRGTTTARPATGSFSAR